MLAAVESEIGGMTLNGKDPLMNAHAPAGQTLFKAISSTASGFPAEDVVNAAVNLMINAIRQQCATRADAGRVFDDMFGRSKQILMNHYDSVGRLRGVFPYDQTIHTELLIDPDLLKKI